MNSMREIICLDCENAITQYEKNHSNENQRPLYKEYKDLSNDIDQKISKLRERADPFHDSKSIENIYQNLEKRKFIKCMILRNQMEEDGLGKNVSKAISDLSLSLSFAFYNAIGSLHNGSWQVPPIYNYTTYPLNAVFSVAMSITAFKDVILTKIFPGNKRPEFISDEELINFFSALHKVQNSKFFNPSEKQNLIQKANRAYDLLPRLSKNMFPEWTDFEKSINGKLSNN